MPKNLTTIFYKNFQIDIAAEMVDGAKWQSQWWIWLSDEAIKFVDDVKFSTEVEANNNSEIRAKNYIDKFS